MEDSTVTSVLSHQLGSAITFWFPSESAGNLCSLGNSGKGEVWPGGTLQSEKGSTVFRKGQRKKGTTREDKLLPQIPPYPPTPAHTWEYCEEEKQTNKQTNKKPRQNKTKQNKETKNEVQEMKEVVGRKDMSTWWRTESITQGLPKCRSSGF